MPGMPCLRLLQAKIPLLLRPSGNSNFFRLFASATSRPTPVSVPQKFIPPDSSLFVSGAASQFATFVVDPYLPYDAIFAQHDRLQADMTARRLPHPLADLRSTWGTFQALRKQREEIESERREKASGRDLSEEQITRARQLRVELKSVAAKISALETPFALDCLKLPTLLHPKAPRSEEAEIIFDSPVEKKREVGADNPTQWGTAVEYTEDSPRGYFLRGALAELELRLLFHSQDHLREQGFAPLSGPHIYRAVVLEGSGVDLSSSAADAFMIKTADSHDSPFRSLYLAHSPLDNFAAYLTNCEAGESILPLRLQSSGRIYRPRASNGGFRDRRSRVLFPDQTHCVSFCIAYSEENQTDALFDNAAADLRRFYSGLGVPFRIVNVPAWKLPPSEALRYQVEVWLPSMEDYAPCGYVAVNNDFVSKRLRCQVGKQEELKFLSMIHGSFIDLTPLAVSCLDNFGDVSRFLLHEKEK